MERRFFFGRGSLGVEVQETSTNENDGRKIKHNINAIRKLSSVFCFFHTNKSCVTTSDENESQETTEKAVECSWLAAYEWGSPSLAKRRDESWRWSWWCWRRVRTGLDLKVREIIWLFPFCTANKLIISWIHKPSISPPPHPSHRPILQIHVNKWINGWRRQ